MSNSTHDIMKSLQKKSPVEGSDINTPQKQVNRPSVSIPYDDDLEQKLKSALAEGLGERFTPFS